jgi:hypothetical protein
VAVPINVVAEGRIVGAPSQVLGEDGPVTVFVLDPFPGMAARAAAHAWEVRCRDRRLAQGVLEHRRFGDCVVVTGAMQLEQVPGPLEDELSALRAGIEADTVVTAAAADEQRPRA